LGLYNGECWYTSIMWPRPACGSPMELPTVVGVNGLRGFMSDDGYVPLGLRVDSDELVTGVKGLRDMLGSLRTADENMSRGFDSSVPVLTGVKGLRGTPTALGAWRNCGRCAAASPLPAALPACAMAGAG